jgi:hypothetical protein
MLWMAKWEYCVIPIDTGPKQLPGSTEPLTEPILSIAAASGWLDSQETIESIEARLQEMGALGWELISVLPDLPSVRRGKETPANPWKFHAVFKRRKSRI